MKENRREISRYMSGKWNDESTGESTGMFQRHFVTKTSDNHISETHITRVCTTYTTIRYNLIWYNSMCILRELVIILRIEIEGLASIESCTLLARYSTNLPSIPCHTISE